MRPKDIETIDELFARNYTVYISLHMWKYLNEIDLIDK
jgi:hypothetical protein